MRLKSTLTSFDRFSCLQRDLFICDDNFKIDLRNLSLLRDLKHPSSSHIISRYSSYIFQNEKYHFNDLGEYSLNVAAYFNLETEQKCITSSVDGQHSHNVFIWPDGLFLKNLNSFSIAQVLSYATNPDSNVSQFIQGFDSIVHEHLNDIIMIIACGSKGLQLINAIKVMAINDTRFSQLRRRMKFVFAAGLQQHRKNSNLLLLRQARNLRMGLNSNVSKSLFMRENMYDNLLPSEVKNLLEMLLEEDNYLHVNE